jgi:hypothetical protein
MIFFDSPKLDSSPFEAEPRSVLAVRPLSKSVLNRRGSRRRILAHEARGPWHAGDFDPILRVQYYESIVSARVPSGELKLLFAVLEDALRCYVLGKSRHSASYQAEFLDAREWFFEGAAARVFSFESVCAILDVDPNCIRRKLDCLEPADIPLQHFCNRRRLSGGKPRTSRSASGAISDSVVSMPKGEALFANTPQPNQLSCSDEKRVDKNRELYRHPALIAGTRP